MSNRKKDFCEACETEVVFKNIKVSSYQYSESGLDNVFLINIPALECPNCGHQSVIIPRPEELHRILAEAIVRKPFKLSGKEIRFLRTALGYSGSDFSKEVKFDYFHFNKVENGHLAVSDELDKEIRLKYLSLRGVPKRTYQALQTALSEVLHPKEVGTKSVTLKFQSDEWTLPKVA